MPIYRNIFFKFSNQYKKVRTQTSCFQIITSLESFYKEHTGKENHHGAG